MTERENSNFLRDLQSYQLRREELWHEHEQLLSRLRPLACPAEELDGQHRLVTRFKELQCLVDIQRRKITDLMTIEKSYQELHREFEILESTNQKLIQQLMLFSEADERKKELEALVAQQHQELYAVRTRLREARAEIDTLNTRLMKLDETNASLADEMEDYRIRLENLLEKEVLNNKRLEQLHAELQNKRKAYETLQRKYHKIQKEYETMYHK